MKKTLCVLLVPILFSVFGSQPAFGKPKISVPVPVFDNPHAIVLDLWSYGSNDSPLNGKIKKFRWFAIHSLNNLDFNAQAVVNNHDVLITVFEEGVKEW
jgi:hypothetical protein